MHYKSISEHIVVCYYSQNADFCPSGQELSVTGCVNCSRDFYKDNTESVHARFELCQPCPNASLTTLTTGASHADECAIGQWIFTYIELVMVFIVYHCHFQMANQKVSSMGLYTYTLYVHVCQGS